MNEEKEAIERLRESQRQLADKYFGVKSSQTKENHMKCPLFLQYSEDAWVNADSISFVCFREKQMRIFTDPSLYDDSYIVVFEPYATSIAKALNITMPD